VLRLFSLALNRGRYVWASIIAHCPISILLLNISSIQTCVTTSLVYTCERVLQTSVRINANANSSVFPISRPILLRPCVKRAVFLVWALASLSLQIASVGSGHHAKKMEVPTSGLGSKSLRDCKKSTSPFSLRAAESRRLKC